MIPPHFRVQVTAFRAKGFLGKNTFRFRQKKRFLTENTLVTPFGITPIVGLTVRY